MEIADIDGDSKLDLIVANAGSSNVGVLLGSGNGTFGLQTTYPTSGTPNSLATTDVNGDNKTDIIVLSINTSKVAVLLSSCN